MLTLAHFQPIFHFYTPWKHKKNFGFLMFPGSIEVKYWLKMSYQNVSYKCLTTYPTFSIIAFLTPTLSSKTFSGNLTLPQKILECSVRPFAAGIYLFKISNGNTRTMCKIWSKFTIKTPERRHWNFDVVLVS